MKLKFPTQDQINKKSAEMFDLAMNGDLLEVTCNDGEVIINCNTREFGYVGIFGSKVLDRIIKDNCMDNFMHKIIILAATMEYYSMNFGGFTIKNKIAVHE